MYFVIYKDAAGEFRWRLRADNLKIVADSAEGYRHKSDCKAAIELIHKSGATCDVIDAAV